MKDSEFRANLQKAGLKPLSILEKVERDFFTLFLFVAVLMACLMIIAFEGQLNGGPVWQPGLLLGMASVLVALHAVNFAFYVRWHKNMKWETAFQAMYDFMKLRSSIYTALAFLFALTAYLESWLYKPFLATALVATAIIAVSCFPTIKAWATGGGQGLSDDEMK